MNKDIEQAIISYKPKGSREWVELGMCSDFSFTETKRYKTVDVKQQCQNRLNLMFVNSYRNIEL